MEDKSKPQNPYKERRDFFWDLDFVLSSCTIDPSPKIIGRTHSSDKICTKKEGTYFGTWICPQILHHGSRSQNKWGTNASPKIPIKKEGTSFGTWICGWGREGGRLGLARVVTKVVAMAELLLRLTLAPRPLAPLLFAASSSSSSSSSVSPSQLQYRPCFHSHRNNNLLSIQQHRSSSTACSVSRLHSEKGSLKNRGRRALPFRVLFTLSAAAALVFLRR